MVTDSFDILINKVDFVHSASSSSDPVNNHKGGQCGKKHVAASSQKLRFFEGKLLQKRRGKG